MTLVYRGVNETIHEQLNGILKPKETILFIKGAEWDEAEFDNAFWDENAQNAVVRHQFHQAGLPTSGISTTPILERAKLYATHNGTYSAGYIYVIDLSMCDEYGVGVYVVGEIVPNPSIPEDQEIILVAKDFGALPSNIVVDVRYFNNNPASIQ